jgi:hypothetical protein
LSSPDKAHNGTLQQTEAAGDYVSSLDTGESGSLDGSEERPAQPADGSRTIDVLLQLTEDIANSGKRLIEIYADRARHTVRKTAIGVGVATCMLVCLLLWLGASTLAVLRGTGAQVSRRCGTGARGPVISPVACSGSRSPGSASTQRCA